MNLRYQFRLFTMAMEGRSTSLMFEVLCWQMVTFGIIWSAYASTYLLRKPASVVKVEIMVSLGIDPAVSGLIDVCMLLPYALVSLFLGGIADRLGPRRTLGYGLLLASAASLPMGSCYSFWQLMILLAISGSGQALCWPAACSLLALWFPTRMRNTVFGAFGTSCFIGGIAGTALTVFIQLVKGWRQVFFPGACIATVLGIVVLLFGRDPQSRGLVVPGCNTPAHKPYQDSILESKDSHISMMSAWKLPLVSEVSASMFCIKAIRYALMMWLPFYLFKTHGYSESTAGLAATAFEMGGAIGSAAMGILVDRWLSGRALFACGLASMGCAITLIALMITSSFGPIAHLVWLIIAGALNCGPDVVLAGSVATRLGEKHGAAAAVTGVINGLGSLGIVLEGPLVALLASWFGWNALLPLMICLCGLAAASGFRAHSLYQKSKLYNSLQNCS